MASERLKARPQVLPPTSKASGIVKTIEKRKSALPMNRRIMFETSVWRIGFGGGSSRRSSAGASVRFQVQSHQGQLGEESGRSSSEVAVVAWQVHLTAPSTIVDYRKAPL